MLSTWSVGGLWLPPTNILNVVGTMVAVMDSFSAMGTPEFIFGGPVSQLIYDTPLGWTLPTRCRSLSTCLELNHIFVVGRMCPGTVGCLVAWLCSTLLFCSKRLYLSGCVKHVINDLMSFPFHVVSFVCYPCDSLCFACVFCWLSSISHL